MNLSVFASRVSPQRVHLWMTQQVNIELVLNDLLAFPTIKFLNHRLDDHVTCQIVDRIRTARRDKRKGLVYSIDGLATQKALHNHMLEGTRHDVCCPEATQIKVAHGSVPPSCRVARAMPHALKPKQHSLSTATCRSCQCLIRFFVDRRCEG